MIIADSTSAIRICESNVTAVDLDTHSGRVTIRSSVDTETLEIDVDDPKNGPGVYMAVVRAVAFKKPLCDIRKFK